ncbi:hypothetical protein VNO78_14913 [Psophocarpus tetragonolobus]|uniref:Uncharacterized protein n=1 Tax=Psophocarpus tetragonolobus TaxID=3891 RepID=A0AAN9SED1_PSOTE
MAIQVTLLPHSAFALCITYRHVAADGRAFHHFIKFWASVCNSKGDLALASLKDTLALALPLHNRNTIQDPKGLKSIFLAELSNFLPLDVESKGIKLDVPSDMVRHTFVLSHDLVQKLKKWVSIKCQSHGLATPHITTFVVTCSLIWVCKVKSEEVVFNSIGILRKLFGCGNAEVKRSKLVGGNGILEAAIAIGSEVRHLKDEALEGAETLMSNFTEFATLGKHMTIIAGSPTLQVYETDFGWGKPMRSEVVHVDNSGSISLSDCRDKEGRIEVGLALQKIQFNKFRTILEDHLKEISVFD